MKKYPFSGQEIQRATIVFTIFGILIFILGMTSVALSDVRPIISVSPMSVNLGSVKLGGQSLPRSVNIKNTGTADLHIITITSADGEFSPSNDCTDTFITPGNVCTFNVIFSPTREFGKRNAILAIASNDSQKPTINVKLLGQAPPPKISVSPMFVNFGSLPVGGESLDKIVTVKNTGLSDLEITSINITGTNATEFTQTNHCTTPVLIPKGSSCTVSVRLSPTLPFGSKSAIMSIASNDPKKPIINVRLMGQAPPPKISVSPQTINFGSLPVGSSPLSKEVRIKNTGISDLNIDSINITDPVNEFSQTSDCPSVGKGAGCTISVSFTPQTAGKKSLIMSIASNDPKKPIVNVKLVGAGTQTTLNPTNASNASGAAMQAARLVSPISALSEIRIESSSNEEEMKPVSIPSQKSPLVSVIEKAISVSRSYKFNRSNDAMHAQGTLPLTIIDCTDGGSIDVNATWTGPDNPASYSQVENLEGTINFDSCTEGTETFNGVIAISFQGYLDRPTKLTITTPNFSYIDTYAENNLTMTNLTLAVSNITYYHNELTGGAIKLNGDVSGVINGESASLNCDNFTLSFTSGLLGVTVSVSGKLKASCLSDWVDITTQTPLFFPSFADTICPTAGQIIIVSGADTVKIIISPDSAISVYFNNALEKIYNDCNDIELKCGTDRQPEGTGVVLDAVITPVYLGSHTYSVDAFQIMCNPGPPPVAEDFTDHNATIAITARLINPNTTFQAGTLYVEKYTVEFKRSSDSIGAPPIQSDTRYKTIVIPAPTGTGVTTVEDTVVLVDLIRKDQYRFDVTSGQYSSGPSYLNNYTAIYTFEGKNEYGAIFSFKAQTDFQIGSIDYCK